jgi:hypothetical protein
VGGWTDGMMQEWAMHPSCMMFTRIDHVAIAIRIDIDIKINTADDDDENDEVPSPHPTSCQYHEFDC